MARPQVWQDYLKYSVEQSIEGNEEEIKFCEERYSQMILYLKRCVLCYFDSLVNVVQIYLIDLLKYLLHQQVD